MRARLRSEEGASLLMVIVFVMVFSVLMATLLDYSTTGFKTSVSYRTIRVDQSAVDGAMENAINSIRRGSPIGLRNPPGVPASSPDYVACGPFTMPAGSGGPNVIVTCEPIGETTLTGGVTDLIPKYAIFATGTEPCDGLVLEGAAQLAVAGGVVSNSRIGVGERLDNSCSNVSNNPNIALRVFGDAIAGRACTAIPKFTATRTRTCNTGTSLATPAYLPAAASVSDVKAASASAAPGAGTVDPFPTCATSSGIVVFTPGVYTEVPKEHATRANCTGSIWWFKPGIYYFDFPSPTDGSMFDAARTTWTINPQNVVGGTPKGGWDATSAPSSVPLRKACENPGVSLSPPPGVQFIFGGSSRIYTQGSGGGGSGEMELCAGVGAGNQRIAVYGLSSTNVTPGNGRATAASVGPLLRADVQPVSTPPTGSTATFSNPQHATAIGETPTPLVATAALSSEGAKSATVTFSSFADIPEGSLVTGIRARVRHSETSSKVIPSLSLRYVRRDLTEVPITLTPTLGNTATMTTYESASFLGGSSGIRSVLAWRDVNSLLATYTVNGPTLTTTEICTPATGPNRCNVSRVLVPETAEASLDGVELEVTYLAPGYRAQSTGTTAFLEHGNNATTLFRGTFYTPAASVRVQVHNAGDHIFGRGVIAKAITASLSASSKQSEAPFSLPGLNPRREVLLTATVDGQVRLRARVSYDDTDGLPGRGVHVLDWVVVR